MSSKVSASAQATFDSAGESSIVLVLEKEDGEAIAVPYGFAWVRVWCSDGSPTLVSTSGQTPSRVNNAVSITITETIVFDNSSTSSLKYANVSNATFSPVGGFLSDTLASVAPPSFTLDVATGDVSASFVCFGALSVTYTSVYERWSCGFARDPNATKGNSKATPPIPPSESAFSPMLVVAKKKGKVASVNLTPPKRSEDPSNGTGQGDGDGLDGGSTFDSGASTPNDSGASAKIVIEPTPAYIDGASSVGVFCQSEIYVYFGALPSRLPVVSEGTIEIPAGSSPFEFVGIKGEQISWANQAVTGLHYLPATNGPAWVHRLSSEYQCRYQTSVLPTFISQPGQLIHPKVFKGQNHYTAGPGRLTKLGDVVVTEFGLAVDVTGSATADYTTNRVRYRIRWPLRGGKFHPLTVSVVVDEFSGSLVINPPNITGRK